MASPPDNQGKPPFPPSIPKQPDTAAPRPLSPGGAPNRPASPPAQPSSVAPPRLAPAVAAPPRIPPPAPAAQRPPPGAPPAAPPAVPRAAAPAEPAGPIPASGPIDQLTPAQMAMLARQAAQARTLDYFQVLKIETIAVPAEIKAAFYRESRIYHPDRFFHLSDEKTKGDLGTIYKRITEAYYFLRDDQKRRKYIADITGPDRNNKLRFSEASEAESKAEVKKQAEEQIGTHPKGRSFFQAALKEVAAESWPAAERSLKTALTYEPSNARYKEELIKVQNKLHDAFKAKGDQFKIR